MLHHSTEGEALVRPCAETEVILLEKHWAAVGTISLYSSRKALFPSLWKRKRPGISAFAYVFMAMNGIGRLRGVAGGGRQTKPSKMKIWYVI